MVRSRSLLRRGPPPSSRIRSARPAAICAGESTRARPAASSIASGSRSSPLQISATSPAVSAVSPKSWAAACRAVDKQAPRRTRRPPSAHRPRAPPVATVAARAKRSRRRRPAADGWWRARADAGSGRQRSDHGCRGVEQMLTVVEHQQRVVVAQQLDGYLERRAAGRRARDVWPNRPDGALHGRGESRR